MNYTRPDKSGNNRSGQRARKLQLSDVDWYDSEPHSSQSQSQSEAPSPNQGASTSRPINSPGPDAAVTSLAVQQRVGRPARATAQVGRLTRKEILREHASRKAGAKAEEKE